MVLNVDVDLVELNSMFEQEANYSAPGDIASYQAALSRLRGRCFAKRDRAAAANGLVRGPDVMCVGAQKGGTTWLQYNLSLHPHVFVPQIKESHYLSSIYFPNYANADELRQENIAATKAAFSVDMLQIEHFERYTQSDEWYSAIFDFALDYQVTVDIDPTLGILPVAGVRHALRLNPNLKIIAILRDPAERALSQLRMELGAASPQRYRQRISQFPHDMAFYYSDYPTWLKRWGGMTGSHNVLALRYEDLGKPLPILRQVCDFLGVTFDPDLFPFPEEHRHKGRLGPENEALLSEIRAALAPVYSEWKMHSENGTA